MIRFSRPDFKRGVDDILTFRMLHPANFTSRRISLSMVWIGLAGMGVFYLVKWVVGWL